MKIECPHCSKTYTIPDERLPADRKELKFSCKECEGIIKVDLRGLAKNDAVEVEEDVSGATEKLKKKILRSMAELPPMPQVVVKAQEKMSDPTSTFKDLGRIIETDQAIAARVLKLANSAYYGLRGMVSSIHQASIVLGYEALGEVITVVGAAGLLDNILEGYGLDSGALWQHSLAVAFGSRIIAKAKHPALENDVFSAGLLHDAGKIVLDEYVHKKEKEFDALMEDGQTSFLTAEKKIFGFDHADLTFELCQKWSIPEIQGLAIKHHHCPSRSEENAMAYILHIADTVAIKGGFGMTSDAMLYEIEEEALTFVGLHEEELEEITNGVIESVDKITEEIHED